VLTVDDRRVYAALWRRSKPPHQESWALPGVFVRGDESLESAVRRALETKLHLDHITYLEQLFAWDKAQRDERGPVVAVAYFALTSPSALRAAIEGRDDICLAELIVPPNDQVGRPRVRDTAGRQLRLAFDHEEILAKVIERIRGKLEYTTLALDVLPDKFTLRELQDVYEALLGHPINKDAFRRRVTLTTRIVEGTGRLQSDVDHRPPELYRRARRPAARR
jgi:8-oxo-dGTP diphosphatase